MKVVFASALVVVNVVLVLVNFNEVSGNLVELELDQAVQSFENLNKAVKYEYIFCSENYKNGD